MTLPSTRVRVLCANIYLLPAGMARWQFHCDDGDGDDDDDDDDDGDDDDDE